MSLVSMLREAVNTANHVVSRSIFLLFIGLAGCQPISLPDQSQLTSGAAAKDKGDSPALPLQLGYYVASDTPCEKASNATLLLLQSHGIGGARDFCEFLRIEQTGSTTFRVEESCADFQGSDPEKRTLQYEIMGGQRLLIKSGEDVFLDARYCAQSDLPAQWQEAAN